jgi:hypothetical protein
MPRLWPGMGILDPGRIDQAGLSKVAPVDGHYVSGCLWTGDRRDPADLPRTGQRRWQQPVWQPGGLCLEPFGFFQSLDDLDLDTTVDLEAFARRTHDLRDNADAYDSPQQHWVAALQGRVELLPTAELALNTMLISEAIYLSDRLGREVSTEELVQSSVSTAISL